MSHEGVGDSLNDGAGGLSESLLLVSTGSVGDVDVGLGGVDGDQVGDGQVLDFDVVLVLTEQLDFLVVEQSVDALLFFY